ncbi:unnamed protein product, partial [Oppiella nova]
MTSISKPYLLFIDEPTTGLDTHAAQVVIQCLKQLSRKHNISVIVSIHQPNNDLFHMFDNIYVLAKGGHCLYDGVPLQLRQHLIDCDITVSENEVPIEVLIKLSFNGREDMDVKRLCDKNKELTVNTENMIAMNAGITTNNKNFYFVDMFNLFIRFFHYTYVSQWKAFVKQLVILIAMTLCLVKCLDENAYKTEGCLHLNATIDSSKQSCIERESEKSILTQTQYFLFLLSLLANVFQVIIISNNMTRDFKIFVAEHQNDARPMKNCIKILDNICGKFYNNSLNALMGPSGAGKTTLLKCLNGQSMSGLSDESRICVKSGGFRTCFIQQDVCQHLLRGLTVRQTLVYASRLKNSRISAHLDHRMIASELMSSLVISDTADNRVETCSGGERKRIVIACELTAHIKPKMLCIDEPTSGLDSSAALVVINCLKVLSRRHGMTIIASIHQPNNDLFHMFDNIYVLAKGGHCLYDGVPLQLKQHLIDCENLLTEYDVPIEVMLKIGSSDDKQSSCFQKLFEKQKAKHSDNKIIAENMRLVYGKQNLTKRFSFRDFYYLLMRSMIYSYISQWRISLSQMVVNPLDTVPIVIKWKWIFKMNNIKYIIGGEIKLFLALTFWYTGTLK